jgi:hypothetical protein
MKIHYLPLLHPQPSAHCLGLSNKSHIPALRNSYDSVREAILTADWSPLHPNHCSLQDEQHFGTSPNDAIDELRKHLQLALAGQALCTREALVFSQGIPIVVSTLLAEFFVRATGKSNRYSAAVDLATWGQQLLGCGFLFGMESLVSAQGKELSMLLDNAAFIQWLECCRIRLVPDTLPTAPAPTSDSNNPFDNLITPQPPSRDEDDNRTMTPWTVALEVLPCEREARPRRPSGAEYQVNEPEASVCEAAPVEHGPDGALERVGAVAVEFCIGIPREILQKMGLLLQESGSSSSNCPHIRIVPVLFTQGINEVQSVANLKSRLKSPTRDVQRDLNMSSTNRVKHYSHRVSVMLANRRANALDPGSQLKVDRYLSSITYAVNALEKVVASQQKHLKDTDVLTNAEEALRALNGGLVTFCKSGKDRTAMAVTLAQARLLLACTDTHTDRPLAPRRTSDGGGEAQQFAVRTQAQDSARLLEVAGVFREFGCRMVVAEKNIGRPQYSFNALQRKLLPLLYRPPVSTIQDMITSVVARDS